MDEHLGYSKSEHSDSDDYRNGYKTKQVNSSWKQNWDAISPIFKFSTVVRKVIYTANAIERLNATYRKRNRQRSVFPSDSALLKALYLSTFEATKKWTMSVRNWGAGLWGTEHYVRGAPVGISAI